MGIRRGTLKIEIVRQYYRIQVYVVVEIEW